MKRGEGKSEAIVVCDCLVSGLLLSLGTGKPGMEIGWAGDRLGGRAKLHFLVTYSFCLPSTQHRRGLRDPIPMSKQGAYQRFNDFLYLGERIQ